MTVSAAECILLNLDLRRPQDIDLEAIAWTLGAAVRYRAMDKSDATIVGSDRRAVITVNSNSIPRRQRFSLAHEIGHWHLHRGQILLCSETDIGNPTHSPLDPEYQADQFASDLILPSFMFEPIVSRLQHATLTAIREIADQFDVSVTATLLKLIDTNQFPLIAVCHSKERRRWFRRARMIPEWWFPRTQLDRDSFAFDMLFKGASESSFPRKIDADSWFEFRGADRYEVREQSFLLPNEEILTMLAVPDDGLG